MNNIKQDLYVTIMAGGVGSRFWPASTTDKPKQFLDILGTGKSLIRQTFERFLNIIPVENILVLTNDRYKGLVKEHLPEIKENNILCEPSMNNTAPAIAYAALRIHSINPDAIFVVAPSDHVILKEEEFLTKILLAVDFAQKEQAILTLGIEPTRPDTGYGYIEVEKQSGKELFGIQKVNAFKEKPNIETAKNYLSEGNYVWNAGIFVWTVKEILRSFDQYTNGIIEILNQMPEFIGSPNEQSYIDKVYPNTKKISIDYAILEHSTNVYTIPADIGWSDLGTWNSLYSYLDKDENGNVVYARQSLIIESNNNFIRVPKNKLIVTKGIDNFIIIDEGDVLLIYPKELEQEIKSVRKKIINN